MAYMAENKEKTEPKFRTTREWLIYQIDLWLAAHPGKSEETFGWLAINDTRLVGRLRDGGDITTRKLDAIIRFLKKTMKGKPNGKEAIQSQVGEKRQGRRSARNGSK
jgi:hypothetical protein